MRHNLTEHLNIQDRVQRLNTPAAGILHASGIAQMFSKQRGVVVFRVPLLCMFLNRGSSHQGYCDFKAVLWLCEWNDTIPFWQKKKPVLSSNLASSDAGGIKCCWVQSQTRTRRFTWTRRFTGGAAEARDSSLSPALTVSDAPARRFPRNTRRLVLSISNSLFVSRRLV